MITVENWRFYQCEFSKLTHEVTQEVTHPKNKKKENINNNNIYIAVIDHLNKAELQIHDEGYKTKNRRTIERVL